MFKKIRGLLPKRWYPYFERWEGRPKGIKYGYNWHFPKFYNGGFAWEIDFGRFSLFYNHKHIR